MPGKSRKRKGKFKQQNKNKKGRQSPQVEISRQEITTRAKETPAASAIMPEVAVSSPVAKAQIFNRNPELLSELKRIGIFAGIMLSVLILLAIVLG